MGELGDRVVLRVWESTVGKPAQIELGTDAGKWFAERTVGERQVTRLVSDERAACDQVDAWLRQLAPAWRELDVGSAQR